jgi:membrane protein DedA with SNARE-associated domain
MLRTGRTVEEVPARTRNDPGSTAAARSSSANGGWVHLNQRRICLAEGWFDRYGSAFVLLGRITPLLRSFVSIPAGVFRVPLGRYSLLTLLGSAIWAFAFAGAGYGLGTGYERAHNDFRYAEYAVVVVVILIAALLVRRHLLPAARRRSPGNE